MRVRPFRYPDVVKLTDIHQRAGYTFPFPDLTNPLYIVKGVAVNDKGDICGAGFVKIISEGILIVDSDLNMKEKIATMDELVMVGQALTWKSGMQDWHVFIDDNDFCTILKKQ